MRNCIGVLVAVLAAGCGDSGVPIPEFHPDLAVDPPDMTFCGDVVISQSLVGGIGGARMGQRDVDMILIYIRNYTCRDIIIQPVDLTITFLNGEVGSLRGTKGTAYVSNIRLTSGDPPRLEDGPYEVRNPGPVSSFNHVMSYNPAPMVIIAKDTVVLTVLADIGYEDDERELAGHTLRATLGDLGNNWLFPPGGICFADNPLCLNSPDTPRVNRNTAQGHSVTIWP